MIANVFLDLPFRRKLVLKSGKLIGSRLVKQLVCILGCDIDLYSLRFE